MKGNTARAPNHFFQACGYWFDLMLCEKIVLKLKTLIRMPKVDNNTLQNENE